MRLILVFCLCICLSDLLGQGLTSDTINLNQVTVKAFESNRKTLEVAAAVSNISNSKIENYNNLGFLPLINSVAGLRMEERSPGSYRIHIRGSNVRSPFGVRNIKIYWNNIPLTDATGLSYFNLLDINSINSIEILKGPSSSIYGAGIGGVILLDSKANAQRNKEFSSLKLDLLLGSYKTINRGLGYYYANSKVNLVVNHSHVETQGYREHSKMARDVLNIRSSHFLNSKHSIHLNLFYSDINYQTPGGLTALQVSTNRRASRPKTNFTRSAIEQNAGIYQKMNTLGITDEWKIAKKISISNSIFGGHSFLKNPFISNFEIRDEKNIGIRTLMKIYPSKTVSIISGFEYLLNNSTFDNNTNNFGEIGVPISFEKIKSDQSSIFLQVEKRFQNDLFLTLGSSLNKQQFNYNRIDILNYTPIKNTSGKPISPRISALKKIGKKNAIYLSYSEGFSAPTVQEFASSINAPKFLEAEIANNIEFGIKSENFLGKLQTELSIYQMKMLNTIVRRTNEFNIEYFTNVGNTNQKGLEFSANYPLKVNKLLIELNSALTLTNYYYVNYQQLNVNYNNNKIPSVSPINQFYSLSLNHQNGLFLFSTLNNVGKSPLDDANLFYNESYKLLNVRCGYRLERKKISSKIFFGVENLLNQKYSLGNDTNAFGNRFFNPSAPRNFNSGIQIQYFINK